MNQALTTTTLTLIGAILLFLVSEFARGLSIKPMIEIRSHIGLIIDRVIFYVADLTSGAPVTKERETLVRTELRTLATQLRAKRHILLGFSFFSTIKLIPKSSKLEEAAAQLTGLSNSFEVYKGATNDNETYFAAAYEYNVVRLDKLQKALGFPKAIIDVSDDVLEKREKRERER